MYQDKKETKKAPQKNGGFLNSKPSSKSLSRPLEAFLRPLSKKYI